MKIVRLYIAGDSPNSSLALKVLREVIADSALECEVEIVDVLRDPQRAEGEGILVVPTLVKVEHGSQRRTHQKLGEKDSVRRFLGIE